MVHPEHDNGWQEYKKLVLFKVETLERRIDPSTASSGAWWPAWSWSASKRW
jgi:hypothetical protein